MEVPPLVFLQCLLALGFVEDQEAHPEQEGANVGSNKDEDQCLHQAGRTRGERVARPDMP